MANTIEILIKAKDQASKEIDQVNKSTKELSKSSAVLQAAFKVAQTAAIGAGLAFLSQVPALTKQGIAIGKAEKALEGYTGSAEEAERWTKAVERAGDGALSTFDAMQNATRFASMGLANTAEEAADLTEIAVTLGAAMGKDATTALEDFSLMLANQSIPRLDTFGISGAAVRDRMQELAEQTGETDRQVLFLNATMEIGSQKLQQLADAGFEATDSTQKLATMFQNAKDSAASFFANGLVPIADGITGIIDAMDEEQQRIIRNTESYEDYEQQLWDLADRAGIGSLAIDKLTEAEWLNQQRVEKVIEWHATWDSSIQATQQYLETFVYTGVDPTTASIAGMTRAVDDVNLVMQAYTDQLLFNLAAANLDADAQFVLAQKLGLIDNETWVAYEAMQGLTEQYETGQITADEYSDAVARLAGAIGSLESKEITITTNYVDTYTVIKDTPQGPVGAQQVGGPVMGGNRYVVGEAGQELFVPNSSGVIVPNHVVHNWNLTINEAGRVVNPVQSFAMLQALAGA